MAASIRGGPAAAFAYSGRGKMGALGHHRAVAELPGGLRLSGLPAWVVWRAFYWSKLPGLDRRLRVALSWLADLVVQPELVQLDLAPVPGVGRAHFDVGEVVFRQGDLADHLYMILDGEAEIVQESASGERVLTRLGPGDYFGEIALLGSDRAARRCAASRAWTSSRCAEATSAPSSRSSPTCAGASRG